MQWPRFRKLPIKQKLVVLSIVVAGTALFIFTLVSAFNQIRSMRQAMLENLTILSESIADLSSAALSFSDKDGAAEILGTLRADRDIEVAAIYDFDGAPFASYFRGAEGSEQQLPKMVSSDAVRFYFQSGHYKFEIFRPINLQDKTIGVLYLLSGTGRMTAHILNSIILLVLSMVVVLAVTVLISARLQGIITRPVSLLASTARDISENGDYGLRVDKLSDDEIGQLIDDFNTMLKGIQERDAELQQHRHNLEMLVQERTEELRAKRDEALAAARAKSEFLANMSHEIRTPMNGVIGVLSLLQDVPMTAEYKRLLETATRSADSLLLIINDILDFSKIDAGKITFESIPFDLRELMEETSELFIDTVNLKNLELTCFVPTSIPCRILGDPTRLRQIITNLLSNAVKFTEAGEVKLSVSVVNRHDSQQELMFTVEDSGIGISDDVTGRLFEKFTQADGSTTRKYGGTGLGLSVCKQLVEQQGGSIGVSSKIGSGTTFWFSIAFDIVEETFPLIPYNKLKGKRYLVAADSRSNRSIIEHYLEFCDAEVLSYPDAGSCLAALNELIRHDKAVDAILIDQRLPDCEGLQFAEAIHRDFGDNAPLMVLMSTMSFVKAQLRRAGVSRSLLKPIRQLDLYNSLADRVARGQKRLEKETIAEQLQTHPRLHGSLLLVDDEPINQNIALAILQKYGLQAEVAGSGREALRMTAERTYSVVLMDIQMPEMSGYETTQLIRKREMEQGLKRSVIIAMTANAMESTRTRCFEVGMDDFFTKPIKPDVLAERLKPWLNTQELGRNANAEVPGASPVARSENVDLPQDQLLWSLKRALEFVGDDEGLFRELVQLFMARNETLLNAIEAAIAAGDSEGLRDAAHAYKGAVGHFAADSVRELALSLESMSKEGRMDSALDEFNRLRVAATRLMDELAVYLGTGGS
ncbi:response regulator [Desulfopila aestuarii]|nr:response regulator [Desulfopila aestuarii]